MEKCPVCGQNCGITHSCPGPNAGHAAAIAQWKAPEGFAPLHYLRQALAIARLKEAAISAASQDENALIYGVTIWVVGQALIIAGSFLSKGQSVHTVAVVLGIGILIVMDAIAVVIQWGTCHLLARWWFDARGTFLGVLRPLLLGSIATWLAVIPVVGLPVAGLWGIAVMTIVFEEVDDIGRMQAFGLSFVIGLIVQGLFATLLTLR